MPSAVSLGDIQGNRKRRSIRHTMEPIENSFFRTLFVRETSFTYSDDGDSPIQEIFRSLVKDDARNELIREDVRQALNEGRRCLILSH